MKTILSILLLSAGLTACVEESYTQSNYSSNTVRSNHYVTAPPANNGYVSRVS